jgi:FkbM family methyltransferase
MDVGAHCGITSIPRAIFIRRCNQNSRVFAFEPGRHYELLERGISLNRLADVVTPVEAAVSDASGPLTFYDLPDYTAGSSLLVSAAERASDLRPTKLQVRGISLDDFARETPLAGNLICKIDTEGADFRVVDGLRESIKKGCVSIQIEFIPRLVDSYASPIDQFVSLAPDFQIFEVTHDGSCRPIAADRNAISEFVQAVRQSDRQYTDILLLPRKLPELKKLIRQIVRQDERITFVRDCVARLGGKIESAIDFETPDGYLFTQMSDLPEVQHVLCLQSSDTERSRIVNEYADNDRVRCSPFHVDEFNDMPLPETQTADLVFCAGILHHLSRPWEAIAWISRASAKYAFVETHYAELPLYRCGPYVGELSPVVSEGQAHAKAAFWPTLGDLLMMLTQHELVPRFIYRISAGHPFRPRIWIFAEKGDSAAKFNGTNPLHPELRESVPGLELGAQPSIFNALEVHAATIKGGGTPFNPETQRREAAEAEIARIVGSRSWRVTAPLRWIYSRLHGAPGGDR